MRSAVALSVGLTLGVGGTLGVQALTDDEAPKSGVQTSKPSFRSEVRKALSEEWGDAYAACITRLRDEYLDKYPGFDPGPPGPRVKRTCRREADAILP